jgi:YidC/Oxa1 family membrane protein insertase
VELVQFDQGDVRPFEVRFDRLRDIESGTRDLYFAEQISEDSYAFYRDYEDEEGTPFRLTKVYRFRPDEYLFDFSIEIEALEPQPVNLNQENIAYTLVWGPILGPTSVIKNRYNVTTQGYYDEGKFHKVMGGAAGCSLRRAEARYEERSEVLDWVAMTNRYFMVSIIPESDNYLYAFDQTTAERYLLGISEPYFRGEEVRDSFTVYAGPKSRTLLRQYGYNLESVLAGRLLKPIVVFLEWMIREFYDFTASYGVAIILMTIVIKIILYPLTYKSFASMRKMSTLQPRMNEIREKYKNNPQQMNREMQAMYKREKVNPMGGCLPMILQLPIFYGLYTALSNMIELRNESFLWIKDLSLPDSVATLNVQLPLLGYRVGEQGFTDINILPFVMTATTLLQSKMTSGGQTNQQGKMMTYLFPIIFFFIFWNMPSGLVLYWTIQNVLTIGQQYYISYRMKKKGSLSSGETGEVVPAGKASTGKAPGSRMAAGRTSAVRTSGKQSGQDRTKRKGLSRAAADARKRLAYKGGTTPKKKSSSSKKKKKKR